MTDELETKAEAEEEEFEIEYEPPTCAQLSDGDLYIGDVDAFMELTGALAIQVRDGGLFMIDKSLKWRNVEEPTKAPKRSGTLSAVKPTTSPQAE